MPISDWKIIGNNINFEDKGVLKELNEIFIKKRGYDFLPPKPREPVFLLLSGGIDSISLWGHLFNRYHSHVYPIHFVPDRGNQFGEIKSIKFFSSFYKKRYPEFFHEVSYFPIKFIFNFKNNLDKKTFFDLPISDNLIFNQKTGQYSSRFSNNPSRLAYYAFGAYEYALKLRMEKNIFIKSIFLGIIKDDGDFSRETTLTVLRSINLSLCLILGDFSWIFTAPLEKKHHFYFTKKSLGQYALKSGVDLEKTWSCSERSDIHCGKCANCLNRQNFYANLHQPDPTRYLSPFFLKWDRLTKKIDSLTHKFVIKNNVQKNTAIQPNSSIEVSADLKCWELNKIYYRLNKQTGAIDKLNKSKSSIWRYVNNLGPLSLKKLFEIMQKNKKVGVKTIKETLFFIKDEAKKGYLIIDKK